MGSGNPMVRKNCNIKDVAAYAGVATSTVSRVLNNRDANQHTSAETRRKILAAAKALNYAPNINAKRLFGKRSQVIGLVVPSHEKHRKHVFADHHLAEIFSGIETALSGTGYRLLMIFNDDSFVRNREYLALFRQRAIDGMLVWGAYADQLFWEEIVDHHYPLVFLSQPNMELQKFNYLIHDYQSAGELALRQLVESGHRRIGWLGGSRDNGILQDMEKGFARVPGAYELHALYGDFSRESGVTMTRRMLETHPGLTALAAANLDIASGAAEACKECGAEVEIIACDSATEAEGDGFSRIAVDDQLLGCEAVKSLLTLIEANEPAVIRKHLQVKLYK